VLLWLTYSLLCMLLLRDVHTSSATINKNISKKKSVTYDGRWTLALYEKVYLAGLVLNLLYTSVVHPLYVAANPKTKHLEFLPLLITSFYCSVGIVYFWIVSYWKLISTFLVQ